mgnify:CR=1 FL=1
MLAGQVRIDHVIQRAGPIERELAQIVDMQIDKGCLRARDRIDQSHHDADTHQPRRQRPERQRPHQQPSATTRTRKSDHPTPFPLTTARQPLTGTGRELDLKTFKLVDQLSGRTLGLRHVAQQATRKLAAAVGEKILSAPGAPARCAGTAAAPAP